MNILSRISWVLVLPVSILVPNALGLATRGRFGAGMVLEPGDWRGSQEQPTFSADPPEEITKSSNPPRAHLVDASS